MTLAFTYEYMTNAFIVAWAMLLAGTLLTDGWWRTKLLLIGGRIIPVLLIACFAAAFVFLPSAPNGASLTSLEGAIAIFTPPERFLTIWIEFLAYALFAGRWIIDDADNRGLSRWIIAPCIAITYISGGLGLLAYLIAAGVVGMRNRVVGNA